MQNLIVRVFGCNSHSAFVSQSQYLDFIFFKTVLLYFSIIQLCLSFQQQFSWLISRFVALQELSVFSFRYNSFNSCFIYFQLSFKKGGKKTYFGEIKVIKLDLQLTFLIDLFNWNVKIHIALLVLLLHEPEDGYRWKLISFHMNTEFTNGMQGFKIQN